MSAMGRERTDTARREADLIREPAQFRPGRFHRLCGGRKQTRVSAWHPVGVIKVAVVTSSDYPMPDGETNEAVIAVLNRHRRLPVRALEALLATILRHDLSVATRAGMAMSALGRERSSGSDRKADHPGLELRG